MSLSSPSGGGGGGGGGGGARERQQMELFLSETAVLLESLDLRGLPKAWTRDAWESQFTEAKEPPEQYRREVLLRDGGERASEDMEAVTDLALKWMSVNQKRAERGGGGEEESNREDEQEGAGAGAGARANDSASSAAAGEDCGYWSNLVRQGIK